MTYITRTFGFMALSTLLLSGIGCVQRNQSSGAYAPAQSAASEVKNFPEGNVWGQQLNGNPKGLLPVWKRYKSLEAGLATALDLSKNELCNELGKINCMDEVSINFFGGNEPHHKLQYEAPDSPSLLTPIALERLIISACGQRIERDKQGSPKVFKNFPLGTGQPTADQLEKASEELYRRFHARDPNDAEQEVVRQAASGLKGQNAALILCAAIGTSSELLFN